MLITCTRCFPVLVRFMSTSPEEGAIGCYCKDCKERQADSTVALDRISVDSQELTPERPSWSAPPQYHPKIYKFLCFTDLFMTDYFIFI